LTGILTPFRWNAIGYSNAKLMAELALNTIGAR
jgi:hypothetical protein